VLLHNLTCIVHAITEFGIDPEFGKPSEDTTQTKAPMLALVQP
jgi:hypothetical protein